MNKKASVLIGFYAFFIAFIIVATKTSGLKSGPCTPGVDFLGFFLFGLIASLLFVISLVLLIAKRGNMIMLVINTLAIIGWWGIFLAGIFYDR